MMALTAIALRTVALNSNGPDSNGPGSNGPHGSATCLLFMRSTPEYFMSLQITLIYSSAP